MKIPLNIATYIATMLVCTTLSCKPENKTRQPTQNAGELISVKLNINSESTKPAPTATDQPEDQTSDIIAIQIYRYEKTAKYAYARGLFSSTSIIPPIDLYSSQQYSIETSIVKNGQNLVAFRTNDRAYYRPFVVGTQPQQITEQFDYISTPFIALSLGEGEIMNENGMRSKYDHPLWARYTGYSEKFTPNSSTPITVNAKRVYAALRIRAEELTSGTVEINLTGAPLIELTPTVNNKDTTILISLAGSRTDPTAWIEDQYTESIPCTITYIATSGNKTLITPLEGSSINITRNYIHPITIQLNKTEQSIITLESGPMIEGEEIFY